MDSNELGLSSQCVLDTKYVAMAACWTKDLQTSQQHELILRPWNLGESA